MKILMLTPYLPYPPSSGGQIRSFNLIKQLSKKHQITLCSLIKYDEDKKFVDKLEPYCKKVYTFKRPEKPWTIDNILKTGFSSYPFLVIRNFSNQQHKALIKIIKDEQFDLIHAETFYVSPHIPNTQTPIVLVDQTIEFKVYEHYVKNYRFPLLRPLLYIDVLKLKYWEKHFWKKAKKVIAVSEKDQKVMEEVVGKQKVRLVPNGVGEDLVENIDLHFNKTILFVGNYAWLQNIEAARILANEVLPLVLESVPDAKVLIAGQFTQKIKDLESEKIILKDLAVDDISGIQQVYRNSGVLVAPLYGPGGTRLKILGAMASKLPVVTTDVGIAGIGQDGKTCLLGETAEQLAKNAVTLLTDKNLYKNIAENARSYVEKNYFYEAISEKLNQVYQEVVEEKIEVKP